MHRNIGHFQIVVATDKDEDKNENKHEEINVDPFCCYWI